MLLNVVTVWWILNERNRLIFRNYRLLFALVVLVLLRPRGSGTTSWTEEKTLHVFREGGKRKRTMRQLSVIEM